MDEVRRHFMVRSAALTALAGSAELLEMLRAVHAEEVSGIKGPPVPDLPLIQISRHVWMIQSPDGFPTPQNQGMMSNIVFIEGSKGIAVIDTGASLQIGEMAIRVLQRSTRKPVIAVINTHYHGDHWLGNQAFMAAFGRDLPIYAHAETRKAIIGAVGIGWQEAMVKWTNQASLGTSIVPPAIDIDHGFVLSLGDVTLQAHHYGQAHTPADISLEIVEDAVMCVGDVMMDRRIANMEDGSYQGTFDTIDKLIANSKTTIWVPGHGNAGQDVLTWQRDLFEGIWDRCMEAVKPGIPLERALAFTLEDRRVSSKAAETKGWERNIGKYVSIAYLEAEQAQF